MIRASDLTIYIASRERPLLAVALVKTMLPSAIVVVAEPEAETYRAAGIPAAQVQTHPSLFGLSRIRNWIVEHCPTPVAIHVEDDFQAMWCNTGGSRIMKDPEWLFALFHSTAIITEEAGAMAFGYGDYIRPLFFRANRPFLFTMGLSIVIGTIGKDVVWDERLPAYALDTDVTMRELLLRRIVFIDTRFSPQNVRMMGHRGGLQAIRTKQMWTDEMAIMTEKWGKESFDMTSRSKQGMLPANKIKVKR